MAKNKKQVSPAQVVLLGFLLLILAGAALLMLPVSTRDRQGAAPLEALFTATSATCVTGLVVRDTCTYWSLFGQAVVLALIQIGGMGVVTMALVVSMLTGRRIGLSQRFLMQESINAPHIGGIVRLTGFAVRTTLAVEGAGAAVLLTRFAPRFGLWKGLWYSIFHAVSAFCNAGFDLMGEGGAFSSLTAFADDPVVNLTIMALIVTGGIGFLTWEDFRNHGPRFRAYSLQTKLVLTVTAVLLILPAVWFFAVEGPRWAGGDTGTRALYAAFQAVTLRTAGFNTVDYTALRSTTLLMMMFLMLVGGAPASTAGGYKVTTLATLALCVRSVFQRRDDVECFDRRLEEDAPRSAAALFFLYIVLFLGGGFFIAAADGAPLLAALFESASAIGTVGLSLGLTPGLGTLSRLALILLMYFGRVGCLTFIYAVAGSRVAAPSRMPRERITIG